MGEDASREARRGGNLIQEGEETFGVHRALAGTQAVFCRYSPPGPTANAHQTSAHVRVLVRGYEGSAHARVLVRGYEGGGLVGIAAGVVGWALKAGSA